MLHCVDLFLTYIGHMKYNKLELYYEILFLLHFKTLKVDNLMSF